MKKKLTIAIAVFLNLLCALKIHAQTTIIMEKEGSLYTVPCKVNDIPMKFIFDTGASNISISLTEAIFMLKNGSLGKEDIIGTSYAQFADGNIAENTAIVLKVVQIGDIKIRNVRASIVHQLSAPLLLGQSAIEKLGKIQLDGNVLTILNGSKNEYNYADYFPVMSAQVSVSNFLNSKNCQRRPVRETCSDIVSIKIQSRLWEKEDVGGKLMSTMPSGAKVKLIMRSYNWWKIEYDGIVGWTNENNLDLPNCMLWLANI